MIFPAVFFRWVGRGGLSAAVAIALSATGLTAVAAETSTTPPPGSAEKLGYAWTNIDALSVRYAKTYGANEAGSVFATIAGQNVVHHPEGLAILGSTLGRERFGINPERLDSAGEVAGFITYPWVDSSLPEPAPSRPTPTETAAPPSPPAPAPTAPWPSAPAPTSTAAPLPTTPPATPPTALPPTQPPPTTEPPTTPVDEQPEAPRTTNAHQIFLAKWDRQGTPRYLLGPDGNPVGFPTLGRIADVADNGDILLNFDTREKTGTYVYRAATRTVDAVPITKGTKVSGIGLLPDGTVVGNRFTYFTPPTVTGPKRPWMETFLWKAGSDFTFLTGLASGAGNTAIAVSRDGRHIVGMSAVGANNKKLTMPVELRVGQPAAPLPLFSGTVPWVPRKVDNQGQVIGDAVGSTSSIRLVRRGTRIDRVDRSLIRNLPDGRMDLVDIVGSGKILAQTVVGRSVNVGWMTPGVDLPPPVSVSTRKFAWTELPELYGARTIKAIAGNDTVLGSVGTYSDYFVARQGHSRILNDLADGLENLTPLYVAASGLVVGTARESASKLSRIIVWSTDGVPSILQDAHGRPAEVGNSTPLAINSRGDILLAGSVSGALYTAADATVHWLPPKYGSRGVPMQLTENGEVLTQQYRGYDDSQPGVPPLPSQPGRPPMPAPSMPMPTQPMPMPTQPMPMPSAPRPTGTAPRPTGHPSEEPSMPGEPPQPPPEEQRRHRQSGDTGHELNLWTPTGGYTALPGVVPDSDDQQAVISGNGQHVAGNLRGTDVWSSTGAVVIHRDGTPATQLPLFRGEDWDVHGIDNTGDIYGYSSWSENRGSTHFLYAKGQFSPLDPTTVVGLPTDGTLSLHGMTSDGHFVAQVGWRVGIITALPTPEPVVTPSTAPTTMPAATRRRD